MLPGLLQAALLTRRLGPVSWARFVVVQRGKLAGLATILRQDPGARKKPWRQRPDAGAGRPEGFAQ